MRTQKRSQSVPRNASSSVSSTARISPNLDNQRNRGGIPDAPAVAPIGAVSVSKVKRKYETNLEKLIV